MPEPSRDKLIAAMQGFTPGSQQWFADRLFGTGTPVNAAEQNKEAVDFGLSMAPVTGEAMSAREAWDASGRGAQAMQQGQYGQAATEYANLISAMLGAAPGVGIIARGTRRGSQWMNRNLPQGVNKLIDAMSPQDAHRTVFSGAGPTRMRGNPIVDESGKPLVVYRGVRPDNDDASSIWLTDDPNHAAQFGDVKSYYARIENPLRLDARNFAATPGIEKLKQKFVEKHGLDPDDWVNDVQDILSAGGWDADEIVHDAVKFGGYDGAIIDNWEGLGRTYLTYDPDAIEEANIPVRFR